MTKVTILSGFLGAGKTTFIKKLIAQVYTGEKLVLIENEFGEIGVDSHFLQDAGIEVTELNSGCICCSLVGDFAVALQKVVTEYQPDRILIEPSGVGKLSDVLNAVTSSSIDIQWDGIITVADVNKVRLYSKNFGEFYHDQIQNAQTIVLSRTQNVTQEKLTQSVNLLRELNQNAPIITTPWEMLSCAQIQEALSQTNSLAETLKKEYTQADHSCGCGSHEHDHSCGCGSHEHDHSCGCSSHEHDHSCGCSAHEHDHSCGCGSHHHTASDTFTSWAIETVKAYSKEQLQDILQTLDYGEYGAILRAKGVVKGEGTAWLHFDYVPEEYEIREGTPDYTGRICVIGADLEQEALETLFTKEN